MVITPADGITVELKGDTVVMALGTREDSQQVKAIQGIITEEYFIGDCVEPKTILEATAAGLSAGLAI
jgi:hypothetical protein